jgi:hypothetical protein
MADRASILNKLRALRSKTVDNGCTEAEAIAAAEKVEALLREYAISRDELDQRDFQEAAYRAADFKRDHRIRHRSLWLVMQSVAELCECKSWWPTKEGGQHGLVARFFGEEQDVDMAVYLMAVIEKAIENEWFVFSFGDPKAHQTSFTDGCAYRIHERLRELRLHTEQFVRAAGKGLVVQTKAMVRARKLEEAGVKIRTVRVGMNQGTSFQSGYAAGNNVAFHQGVRHDGKARPNHSAVPLRLGHG